MLRQLLGLTGPSTPSSVSTTGRNTSRRPSDDRPNRLQQHGPAGKGPMAVTVEGTLRVVSCADCYAA